MRIKDICSGVTDGSHNPPQGLENSDYLMLSSKNVFDDKITFDSPRYLSQIDFEQESKRTRIKSGDVLLTIVGTVGRAAVVGENMPQFTLQRSVAVLHPNVEICDSRYLMYALQANRNHIESRAKGVAQKGIYLKEVADIELQIPLLSEQTHRVKVLDKIAFVIKFHQKQLQKLDELVKARFVELFGDPLLDDGRYCKAPLGCLAQVGSSKRIFEKEYVSEGIPFYRTKEIVELSNGNKISTELFITPKRYNEIRNEYGVPQAGDLLISAVGTIGVIWIVDGKNDFYFKDGNLLRVANSDNFMPVYLKCLLETLICAHKSKMSSGTAYAALTISTLKEMSVYKVPLAEQSQFSTFVSQVDKSKVAVQKSLDEAQLLFDSLMQQYFG